MKKLLLVLQFIIGIVLIALVILPLFDVDIEFLNDFMYNREVLYKWLATGLAGVFLVLSVVLLILPWKEK